MPEWTRNLLLASGLAGVVVVAALALAQFVLVPASHSPVVLQSHVGSIILTVFGLA